MHAFAVHIYKDRVRRAVGYPPPTNVFREMVYQADRLGLINEEAWARKQSKRQCVRQFENVLAYVVADRECGMRAGYRPSIYGKHYEARWDNELRDWVA